MLRLDSLGKSLCDRIEKDLFVDLRAFKLLLPMSADFARAFLKRLSPQMLRKLEILRLPSSDPKESAFIIQSMPWLAQHSH